MRYQTSQYDEYAIVIGILTPDDRDVFIDLWNLNTESPIIISSNSCYELGNRTGIYAWKSNNIMSQPTSLTHIVYRMTDSKGVEYFGNFILGGYPDKISSNKALINDLIKLCSNKVTKEADTITIFEGDGLTIWRQYNLADGGRVEI